MADTVPLDDPRAQPEAVRALLAGHAVIVPTDTVYGLAVLPSVPGATEQVYELKGRPPDVPLAVLVADLDQAADLARLPATDAPIRRALDTLWPGPLTVVFDRVDGAGTIGVRCPDHGFVRALAAEVGPLATTSANRHGDPTPTTAADAAASLTAEVALVVDGGRCDGVASTVLDATGDTLRVLRAGPIDLAAIEAAGRPVS